jgi:hypothetical protein
LGKERTSTRGMRKDIVVMNDKVGKDKEMLKVKERMKENNIDNNKIRINKKVEKKKKRRVKQKAKWKEKQAEKKIAQLECKQRYCAAIVSPADIGRNWKLGGYGKRLVENEQVNV